MPSAKKKLCPQVHPTGERCVLDAGHEKQGIPHRLPAAHRCHARGCLVRVKPEMLMCRMHWLRVPGQIQRAVWRAYRVGQCDDKNPSEAWHEAAIAAIAYNAILDDEIVTVKELEALKKFGWGTVCDSDGKLKPVPIGEA